MTMTLLSFLGSPGYVFGPYCFQHHVVLHIFSKVDYDEVFVPNQNQVGSIGHRKSFRSCWFDRGIVRLLRGHSEAHVG